MCTPRFLLFVSLRQPYMFTEHSAWHPTCAPSAPVLFSQHYSLRALVTLIGSLPDTLDMLLQHSCTVQMTPHVCHLSTWSCSHNTYITPQVCHFNTSTCPQHSSQHPMPATLAHDHVIRTPDTNRCHVPTTHMHVVTALQHVCNFSIQTCSNKHST